MLNVPQEDKYLPFPISVMAKPRGPICNIGCEYCFYLRKQEMLDDGSNFRMNSEVLEAYTKQYIRCMADRSPVNFLWQGGEPTLMGLDFFKEAVELQHGYRPDGCEVANALQTNGLLLDDAWCEFLAENNFLVGLSMDGPAHMHNAHRHTLGGEGTHERVEAALKLLMRHHMQCNVLCVVNSVNATQPKQLYRYFRELGVEWMQFIPAVELLPDGSLTEWSVTADAWGSFLCGVFDEWHRKETATVYVQLFHNALEAVGEFNPSLCVHSKYCGNNVVLEHNGDLYSCDHFVTPDHKLGNILEEDLAYLVQLPSQIEWGMSKDTALTRQCKECQYLTYCHGGCLKDRKGVSKYGEPGHNLLCEGYWKFYRHTHDAWARMISWIDEGQDMMDYRPDAPIITAAPDKPAPGRNDPCPCGSGKKYKRCCGR